MTRCGIGSIGNHSGSRLMTKDEQVLYWLESARHDLETAETLYANKNSTGACSLGISLLKKL